MAIVQRKIKTKTEGVSGAAISSLDALRATLPSEIMQGEQLDVEALAKALGLTVVREAMEDDISGYLEKRLSGWVLGINAYHHPVRQRFTLAHEIAHFVLHKSRQQQFKDHTFARRNASGDRMEWEADDFAAKLLMPEERVRAAISSGVRSLNDLASVFGVSSLAMKYRLKNLNYSFA